LLPALDDSPGWHRLSTSVTPEPGTVALRLFLYADARLDAPTTSDYRTLSVTPLLAIALLESPAESPLPVVTYRRLGADRFRAHVQGARAAFLLVADETYSPGWHVEGPRRPGRSEHLTVNGYANGWLVPWKGTYDLTIAYSPERYATIAGWIGIIVSTIVVGTLLGVAVGRLLPARPRLAAPGDSVSAARP
jgi:hypothetical protein